MRSSFAWAAPAAKTAMTPRQLTSANFRIGILPPTMSGRPTLTSRRPTDELPTACHAGEGTCPAKRTRKRQDCVALTFLRPEAVAIKLRPACRPPQLNPCAGVACAPRKVGMSDVLYLHANIRILTGVIVW